VQLNCHPEIVICFDCLDWLVASRDMQLADEWRNAGMEVKAPFDTDYGKHEGSHIDPDGNIIRFGSPIRTST
jgi:hypothetical protein